MKATLQTRKSLISLLKSCTGLRDLERGHDIHLAIVQNALLQKDAFLCSMLVDMYVKCGSVPQAQEVFDMLSSRDVVTWTALIAGYAQSNSEGGKALSYFRRMQLEASCPNAFTFSSVLKACGNMERTDGGREIHATVSFSGLFQSNLIVATALIGMYAKWGNFDNAEEAFSRLSVRDEVVWTTLISGYVDYEHGMEALESVGQMHCDRVSPSAVTYACILRACVIVGDTEKGRDVHSEIVKRNLLRRDVVLGNALIDMYGKCGHLAEAKAVFDHLEVRDVVSWTALIAGYVDHELGEDACVCYIKMQNEGVSPDAYAFSCCLKACGDIGAAEKGEDVHADIIGTQFSDGDLVVCTALVDMYAKCGLLDKAYDVFSKLPVRDKVLWNSLLTGYSQHGDVENMLSLFDRMREDQYEPHSITFVNIINACSHAGLVEKGHTCFGLMRKEFGITPGVEHHACMIDLYGRAGRVEEAVVMLRKLPFHPNMVMLLSILGACRKLNYLEVGFQAFQQALELCKQQASVYVGMLNLYAAGEMEEDISYKW